MNTQHADVAAISLGYLDGVDPRDIAARRAGYLDQSGALTLAGKQYVNEILARLGIPERAPVERLTPSEMGKRSAAKRAGQANIALDVARRTNSDVA